MLRIDEIIETFRYVARIMGGKYYHSNFINRNDIFDAVANLLLDFLEGNPRGMGFNVTFSRFVDINNIGKCAN
jgi:hypothetical protein